MLRVDADDTDAAFSAKDFAIFADFFHASSNLHNINLK